jgi:predicted DNA-binding transcriptional regulator YafY
MEKPGFWDIQENAQRVISRLKYIKGLVEPVRRLDQEIEDVQVLAPESLRKAVADKLRAAARLYD